MLKRFQFGRIAQQLVRIAMGGAGIAAGADFYSLQAFGCHMVQHFLKRLLLEQYSEYTQFHYKKHLRYG
ncbi:hypothetical protein D3C75_781620 [compost metagenome]